MKRIITLVLVLLISATSCFIQAQVSHGGNPYSIMFTIDNQYQTLSLDKPDMQKIRQEDAIEKSFGGPGPWRMGVSVPVNRNIFIFPKAANFFFITRINVR